ncbi:hypothetical protein PG994_006686 [Apiospora phragmitis]|uniref:Carrier domain-containing protein n=1 Tax=Apiospora phragmitis TaxID=2905665 RepID=A0ABR1VIN2_9PEZI
MTYTTITPIFRGSGGDGQFIEALKLSFSIALHHFYDAGEYVVFREDIDLSGTTNQNGDGEPKKKNSGSGKRVTYDPHMYQNVSCSEALEYSFSSSNGDVGPLTSLADSEKGRNPISTPYLKVFNCDSPAPLNNETQYDDIGLTAYHPVVQSPHLRAVHKERLQSLAPLQRVRILGLPDAGVRQDAGEASKHHRRDAIGSRLRLELAGDEDRHMIGDWNRELTVAERACLHHLVERTTRSRPDDPAIVSWDGTLTYRELDSLASRLASHLSTKYDAGGAYCCLDPAHPRARHEYIINSVNASLIIASPHQAHLFEGITDATTVLTLNGHALDSLLPPPAAASSASSFSCATVAPDDTCMIAFTSGSTGVPKGIVHTHRTVTTGLIESAPRQHLNQPGTRVFQWAAYTFDVSLSEIFGPLLHGGVVCVPSEDARLNDVAGAMNRMRCEWAFFTPTFSRFFRRCGDVPSLQVLAMGGEAVLDDDINAWVGRVRSVLQVYGPAECVTWFIKEYTEPTHTTISFGKPTNVHGWIVDPDNEERLMPVGAVGELLIEGPGVLVEYLNDAVKNKSAFVQAPPQWRKDIGAPCTDRIYKSGDLIRYLPNGEMAYIGRKDAMVKLRGQRIDLGEIESVLRVALGDTADVAVDVVVPTGKNRDQALVAFVRLREQAAAAQETLAELVPSLQVQLRNNLPEFMVPRIFYHMEEFPYNASRKLDRKALREFGSSLTIDALMQPSAAAAAEKNGTPHNSTTFTPAEKCFQTLWATLLHVEPSEVKLDDNFFALGGSSLSAIRFIAAARDAGYSITYTGIFKNPTLGEVARSATPKVERQSGEETIAPFALVREDRRSVVLEEASTQCAVAEADIVEVVPSTPQQEGLWALSLASDGNYGSYIPHFTIRLREATDVARLCTAWKTVANNAAFMRSRFVQSNDGAYQVVLKSAAAWKEGVSVQDFVQSELNEPVDFGKPITSYGLIRDEPSLKPAFGFSNDLIVWQSHHGLYDGHSVVLFLNAVAEVYRGDTFGPEVPFTRFIQHLQTVDEGACRDFWRSRYDGSKAATNFPQIPYPTYRPRPSGFYRRSIVFQQPGHSCITKANVLRAALALTIAQVTGASNVNFLETLDGRSVAVPGVESIIGPTFNTVPRSTAVDLGLTVEQFLLRMQDTSTEMMSYSLYGLQNICTLSPQCASACEFQSLLVIEPTYLREYTDVFEFDETGRGIHRFTSDCILWKCDMHDDGVELATSFDEHVIGARELRWVVNLFEENLYFLCSGEQSLPLSANPATPIASHALAGRVAGNGIATASVPAVTKGSTPALLNGVSSQVSQLLKKAWVGTLGVEEDKFSSSDNFFLKGGNSIRAMEFVAAARALGIYITVAKVFQNPSFHALVQVAALQNIERDDDCLSFSLLGPHYTKDELVRVAVMQCNISSSEIEDILPATPLQAEFMASSISKTGAWMAQTQYTFPEDMSVESIKSIWTNIHEHYRTLRTRLVQTSLGVYQVVTRSPPLWREFGNSSAFMEADREITMKYGDALTRYAIGPATSTDGGRRMVFTMHHSIYDGFTLDKLLHGLDQAMHGHQLPPAPTSTLFMRHIASIDEAAAKSFWQKYLSGYSGRDAFSPRAGASHVPEADRTLKIGIKLPTQREWPSITLPTIILGAWALVVGYCTGEVEDVAFGTRVSGRSAPVQSILDMLEPTIAHIPVRVKISRNQSVENFLHQLQIEQSDVMAFEQIGLAKIAAYVEDCRAACSFQNMLVIQRPSEEVVDELGQQFGVHEELSDYKYFSDWALLVDVFPSLAGDGAQLVFCYDSSILSDGRIREMAQRLERAIALLASSKDGIAGTIAAIRSDIDL